VPLLEQARSHLLAALEVSSEHPTSRRFYRDNLRLMARCYLDQGDHPRLVPIAEELARFGYDPAKDTYSAASLLGRCMTLADKDSRLVEAKRRELSQSYADRALALLRQAVERGYKGAAHMKKDSDLEPLRTRKEFQKLLADLEGKAKE